MILYSERGKSVNLVREANTEDAFGEEEEPPNWSGKVCLTMKSQIPGIQSAQCLRLEFVVQKIEHINIQSGQWTLYSMQYFFTGCAWRKLEEVPNFMTAKCMGMSISLRKCMKRQQISFFLFLRHETFS